MGTDKVENALSERSLSRRGFAQSLGAAVLGTTVGAPLIGAAQAEAAGTAEGLNPTAVKTRAYTAAPGDYVPVNIENGSVAIKLPSAPLGKTRIGVQVVAVSGTPGSTTVTINRGGSDVFNIAGGSTSLTLSAKFQSVLLQYHAGIWYVQSTDTPLNQALGSAQLGKDATVGGEGGSALSRSVVTSSSPSAVMVRNAQFSLRDMVSVKDFGSNVGTGNAEADDAAFQAAVATVAADTYHRPIFVPPGHYVPTTTIKLFSGFAMYGLVDDREFSDRTVVQNETHDMFALPGASVKDCSFERICFNGNGSSKTTNWLTPDGTNVLEYSRIRACGYNYFAAVMNAKVTGITLDHSYINNGGPSTQLTLGGADSVIGPQNFISCPALTGNPSVNFIVKLSLQQSLITRNFISGKHAMPLSVVGSDCVYAFNSLDGNPTEVDGAGIYIDEATGMTFLANTLTKCAQKGFEQYSAGITLYDSSAITFLGNIFDEMAGTTAYRIGQSVGTTDSIKIIGSEYRGGVSTRIVTAGTVTNLYAPEDIGPLVQTANTAGKTSKELDELFPFTPPAGTIIVDTTNNIYLQRETTKWYKSAALTEIA